MPIVETAPDVELNVLEELDLNIKPKCEAQGCDRDATLMIHCPICEQGAEPSGEFSCTHCYMLLMATNSIIIFEKDKSCDHAVPITECNITPL